MQKLFLYHLAIIFPLLVLFIPLMANGQEQEKIIVIKGAIAAGSDQDLTVFLTAHLSDDIKKIDTMIENKKIGMTQEEIPALLVKCAQHKKHTNCLVKRIDTGKYFWTFDRCIYHAYGKLTGERIFFPKKSQ